MRTIAGSVALTLILPTLLIAQQAMTGKWEGLTPNKSPILLELAAKGAELAGTMKVGEEKSPIENGKTSKTGLTFRVAMGGGVEAFTGELAGGELKLWMDDRGPASAITLKRATTPAPK